MKFLLVLFCAFSLSLFGNAYDSEQKICNSPRVYYIPNFLTLNECDHIIEQARPHLKRSMVLDAGEGQIDPRRSSHGMFFPSNPSDPILISIEKRIADLTQYPIENGEGLQVLCYQKGGEYQPHYDYFNPTQPGGLEALSRGGQRVISVIMYLNTPEKGGETIFPLGKVSVTPVKGSAVLFFNVTSMGVADLQSLHGGAPVLEGEKWIVTKWIREHTFQ